jgi:hypothetical protein
MKRCILSHLTSIQLLGLICAMILTLPSATAIAQDKPGSKLPVNDPNADITFKRFGDPLAIDIGDGKERTLYIQDGGHPQDKDDPALWTYYHDLALALVPRKTPLPGFPAWVQKVINLEDSTSIDVDFRLSSPKLRAAAEAKLLSDKRAFFERKRQELKVAAIKVKVEPVPAYELRVYIQDLDSGLTLASAQKHVRNWTKDVTLTFRFNKESLAMFLNCEKRNRLEFTPYYKARASHYIAARKQTILNYAVGLKVKQHLDHQQLPKFKHEDENTILPILQDHVNKIARKIGTDINSDIVATDPALITFLHSDTMLVASCFDSGNNMDFGDFRKAYPDFTDTMLAEYLKPYGVTTTKIDEKQISDGKKRTEEKTKQSGAGIGFSIDLGPVAIGAGGQKENAERILDTIYNATGIRLVKGDSETFYKPAKVKVFKLAKGYEEKTLSQASSVTVTKDPVQSYLDISSFPPSYDVMIVENALDKVLDKNDHVARLLSEKAAFEVKRNSELDRLTSLKKKLDDTTKEIENKHKEIADAQIALASRQIEAEHINGFLSALRHGRRSGWVEQRHLDFHEKKEGPQLDAKNREAAEARTVVNQKSQELAKLITNMNKQVADCENIKKEIVQLNGKIETVMKEILSILER